MSNDKLDNHRGMLHKDEVKISYFGDDITHWKINEKKFNKSKNELTTEKNNVSPYLHSYFDNVPLLHSTYKLDTRNCFACDINPTSTINNGKECNCRQQCEYRKVTDVFDIEHPHLREFNIRHIGDVSKYTHSNLKSEHNCGIKDGELCVHEENVHKEDCFNKLNLSGEKCRNTNAMACSKSHEHKDFINVDSICNKRTSPVANKNVNFCRAKCFSCHGYCRPNYENGIRSNDVWECEHVMGQSKAFSYCRNKHFCEVDHINEKNTYWGDCIRCMEKKFKLMKNYKSIKKEEWENKKREDIVEISNISNTTHFKPLIPNITVSPIHRFSYKYNGYGDFSDLDLEKKLMEHHLKGNTNYLLSTNIVRSMDLDEMEAQRSEHLSRKYSIGKKVTHILKEHCSENREYSSHATGSSQKENEKNEKKKKEECNHYIEDTIATINMESIRNDVNNNIIYSNNSENNGNKNNSHHNSKEYVENYISNFKNNIGEIRRNHLHINRNSLYDNSENTIRRRNMYTKNTEHIYNESFSLSERIKNESLKHNKIKIDYLFQKNNHYKKNNELFLYNSKNDLNINIRNRESSNEFNRRCSHPYDERFDGMIERKEDLFKIERYRVIKPDGEYMEESNICKQDIEVLNLLVKGDIECHALQKKNYKIVKIKEFYLDTIPYSIEINSLIWEKQNNQLVIRGLKDVIGVSYERSNRRKREENDSEPSLVVIDALRLSEITRESLRRELNRFLHMMVFDLTKNFRESKIKIKIKLEDIQELDRLKRLIAQLHELNFWCSSQSMIYLEEECSKNDNIFYDHEKMLYMTKRNSDILFFKRNWDYDTLLNMTEVRVANKEIRIIKLHLYCEGTGGIKIFTNIYKFVLITTTSISVFYIDKSLILHSREVAIQQYISKGSFGAVYQGILWKGGKFNKKELETLELMKITGECNDQPLNKLSKNNINNNNNNINNNNNNNNSDRHIESCDRYGVNTVNGISNGCCSSQEESYEHEHDNVISVPRGEKRICANKVSMQPAYDNLHALNYKNDENYHESKKILKMWKRDKTSIYEINETLKSADIRKNANVCDRIILYHMNEKKSDCAYWGFSGLNGVFADVCRFNKIHSDNKIDLVEVYNEVDLLYKRMEGLGNESYLFLHVYTIYNYLLAEKYYNTTVYKNRGNRWMFQSSSIITFGIHENCFYFFDNKNVFHYFDSNLIFKIILKKKKKIKYNEKIEEEDHFEGMKLLPLFAVLGLNKQSEESFDVTENISNHHNLLDSYPDLKNKVYKCKYELSKLQIIIFSKMDKERLEHAIVYCFLHFIFNLLENTCNKIVRNNAFCKMISGWIKSDEYDIYEEESENGDDGNGNNELGKQGRNKLINLEGDTVVIFNTSCQCFPSDNKRNKNDIGSFKVEEKNLLVKNELNKKKGKKDKKEKSTRCSYKVCFSHANLVSDSKKGKIQVEEDGENEEKNADKKRHNISHINFACEYVTPPKEIIAVKVNDLKDGMNLKNFLREIEIYKNINFFNVCHFHGIRINGNQIMIALEYCPLGNLFNFLRNNKKVPKQQRLQWSIELAKIVRRFHSHTPAIVNGDIKTSNILINNTMNLVMCDFGKARFKHSTLYSNFGSYRYMAPETFDSSSEIDEKVDIWSLACCIIEIFTGNYPFHKISKITYVRQELLYNKRTPTIPTFLPLSVQDILKRAFSYSPRERPTAYEIQKALKKIKVIQSCVYEKL